MSLSDVKYQRLEKGGPRKTHHHPQCYDFEDIVLMSDEYLNSWSEKLRWDPQE